LAQQVEDGRITVAGTLTMIRCSHWELPQVLQREISHRSGPPQQDIRSDAEHGASSR
jgi:hypothetical protein